MDTMTCAVAVCDRPRYRQDDLCKSHYAYRRRHGGKMPTHQLRAWRRPAPERFATKYTKTAGSCWVWNAKINASGYGVFGITPTNIVLAHRYAYELLVGPIPDGLQLDHLCRVRACCNPDHLEPVTNRENVIRGHLARGVRRQPR